MLACFALLLLAVLCDCLERRGWRFIPLFEKRDVWVGLFFDPKKRRVYVMLLPTLGFIIEYP